VEELHEGNVILEIWGRQQTVTVSPDSTLQQIRIGYVLIPVLADPDANASRSGVQLIDYTGVPESGQAAPVEFLEHARELHAFVKIGVGINLLLNHQYDLARRCLCEAKIQFEECLNLSSADGPSPRQVALLNYVELVAQEVLVRAKQDPSYEGGLLLVPDDLECPASEGGTP
jgi:hypothetical protein